MRVLYVLTDADTGGAERFVLTLLRHHRPEDEVGVCVLLGRGALSSALDSAADWSRHLGFAPSSRRLDRMVRALESAIRDFRPDVISSHLFHADLVTALARTGVPRTTTVHTQAFSRDDHWLTPWIARVVGLLSARFEAVIPTSPSPQMRAFLAKYRYQHLVPAIRNSADLPGAPSWRPESRRFVSLARNHPVKGHRVLFEAAVTTLAKHPEWSLDCYGADVTSTDPRMREWVKAAGADELIDNGRIRLLGPTEVPEQALSTASALVISSTYGEAYPIVGIEAAGHGVPVIATEVGSTPEFVDDRAFLAKPGDPVSLAKAMTSWAEADDHARSALSSAARRRAERDYAPSTAVLAYAAVFEELVDSR